MEVVKLVIAGTAIIAVFVALFLCFFNRIYGIDRKRDRALMWWHSLSAQEQMDIEADFFEPDATGDVTQIDIEVMYAIYGKS